MDRKKIFLSVEKLGHPATILFRGIELKCLLTNCRKELSIRGTVVDLGCGEGIIASAIFPKRSVIGVDNDLGMAARARQRGVYRRVICTSATNLPFPDRSVDLMFSNSVLEHIPQLDLVLSEVVRVLKESSGRFVFTVPTATLGDYSVFSRAGLTTLSRWYGMWRNRKFQHYHAYTPETWLKLLTHKGLEVTGMYGYLSRKETEMWDMFLILGTCFSLLPSPVASWVYRTCVQKTLWQTFDAALPFHDGGSAVCIIGKVV